MPTIVLGVTGSVAAYRAADVARELMQAGFSVKACLTRAAQEFVTLQLFESLTGNPCLTHVFDEPVAGEMAHIIWAREARVILICPATANFIAALANGVAEDMLTTIAVASDAPLVIAPAMNPTMFASEGVQENLKKLQNRGAIVVMPATGDVACGEHGQGKLASVDELAKVCIEAAVRSALFAGKRVLVTAGPTRERLDPVRYISNRSSGKMGFAIARALNQMGALVTLVAGPTAITPPAVSDLIQVESAAEMADTCSGRANQVELAICVAAVADYKAADHSDQKLKKRDAVSIELVRTADVIEAITRVAPKLPVVGFAAETNDHQDHAMHKLKSKGLFAIALNSVDRTDIGFESSENELKLFFSNGEIIEIEKQSKFNVAVQLLTAISERLG